MVVEGGAKLARPIDDFIFPNLQQEIQLLSKEVVIILKIQAKEWIAVCE